MSTSATPKEITAAIGDALASAGVLLQAGNMNEAEQLYRAVLQLDPNHPDANHALARIAAHCGQMDAAAHLFTTALLAAPSREHFWLDYLEALVAVGEIAAAKQTLELSREHGLRLRGPIIERIEPPSRKPAPQPTAAELKALNDAFQRRDLKKLETLAQEAARKYPEATAGWKSLSLAYYHSGRAELALMPSLKLVELLPDDALMHGNLGLIYMTLRQFPEAEASLQHSITLNPDGADTHVNLGNVRRDQGRHSEAESCYRRALALEPKHSVALANLGVVQLELGDLRGAETSLRAALALSPNSAITLGGLATALVRLGKLEEAAEVSRRSISIDPNNIFAYDLQLFCLNYTHTGKSAEARDLALRYDKHVRNRIEAGYTQWNFELAPKRLKVGLVSGDFNNHPVGFFTEGLLRHLDPARVEVIAYSSMPERKNDGMTARLRGLVSTWRPIHLLSYKQAAAQIHADGIHVLIDLSGHTTDNRLPVFAMKPAPVQASWLGYFATTGVAEMDWFIGDPWLCPPEEEDDFTEQVWRLPQTWLCFTPPEVEVAVAELPALKNGYVTFGCFNNLNKMNDAVVSLWAALLKRLPTARLFLKAPQLRDAEVRAATISRYSAHGITSDRLILEGPDTRENYLATYGKVDIGLDPFPYPGGTTSVESLWMGVPVLTLRGDRFLSHLGESIAHNAGLADWICSDAEDYLGKAVVFATDLTALAALRRDMRARMLASPLLDAEGFARGFEDMLWGIWERKDQPRKKAATAASQPSLPQPVSRKQPQQKEIEQLQQLFRKGRYAELEKKGQSVAQRYPHAVAGWKALSLAQYALNKFEPALTSTQALLELLPNEALSHSRLGAILVGLKRMPEAESAFLRALALDPELAEAHVNLGYIRRQQGRIDEAADCYRQAIANDAKNAVAQSNLGVILLEKHDFRSAEAAFRAALALDTKDETALLGLASTLTNLGNLPEAEALARRLIEINPRNALAYSTLLFIFNYGRNGSADEALELARRYGAMLTKSVKRPYTDWRCEAAPQRLKIGIVSGDLYSHPVGYFLESLLQHLDSAHVEITAYANRPERRNDATSQKLRARCVAWKDIQALDDDATAALIHADGIHILLDLAGHTGNNRLPVFARKPAPIQAAWLGYFATTGVEQMDYLIGDPNVCPPGEESHFTEAIWRLPETYLCFTPPDADIAVGPLPALANGYVTFGCFNNVGKLNDAVITLWSRILDHVPDSRLLLKAKQLGDAVTATELVARFAAHGIATDRLIIEGPSPRQDYLAAYNRVDIVLDPFPYPGGTTSVEALWMGAPVLTLRGERMLAHAGENIMRNMGLPGWIAQDQQEYLHKATQFAADPLALAALRCGLRARALASPMFDAPRFGRFFEEALQAMWQTARKGSAE